MSFLTSKRVVVTGGAGFAGSHLIEHLAGHAPVVGWSRSNPPQFLAPLAAWTTCAAA